MMREYLEWPRSRSAPDPTHLSRHCLNTILGGGVDNPTHRLYSIALKATMTPSGNPITSPLVKAIKTAYLRGEEDESLEPIIAVDSRGCPIGRLEKRDYVIFYDIRGEREVELTESLTRSDFAHFPVKKNLQLNFVTMIDYHPSLDVKVAFASDESVKNTLSEVLSKSGFRQLKIAESEKAIHVGYFMNGKHHQAFPGEERIIIPSASGTSPHATFPEMRARDITEMVQEQTRDLSYDVYVVNLANVDVIGHVEDKEAVMKAVTTVDDELGRIAEICRRQKITLLVTSDHGTAEEWHYEDGTINTGHTKNPVPFILADFSLDLPQKLRLKSEGELQDVAPTILELLALKKPAEMTGESLLCDGRKKDSLKRKILLLILDGWGLREEEEGNLIAEAETINFDLLWSEFPHSRLKASGEAVGMPSDTVGNSEAGHLHLGAGRKILLDRVRIDRAIKEGSFSKNKAFLWAMKGAKRSGRSLHLLGIVSHYSSHGTIQHLEELLRLAKNHELKNVFVHALIGRRGEKPESGAAYVNRVERMCRNFSVGCVATVMGRYWALDREENWDRIQKAYRALVYGEGIRVLC